MAKPNHPSPLRARGKASKAAKAPLPVPWTPRISLPVDPPLQRKLDRLSNLHGMAQDQVASAMLCLIGRGKLSFDRAMGLIPPPEQTQGKPMPGGRGTTAPSPVPRRRTLRVCVSGPMVDKLNDFAQRSGLSAGRIAALMLLPGVNIPEVIEAKSALRSQRERDLEVGLSSRPASAPTPPAGPAATPPAATT